MGQQRTFFQRFGMHGICILPDEVLSDDPLIDPDTGEVLPSLREQICLVNGISHRILCYARVLQICGDGLYWADVAATPEFANAHRVVLTEEHLYSALPHDVRVQGKSPAHILRMMHAHTREVRSVQRVEPAGTIELSPTPVLPLEVLAMVEVSTDELQEAIGLVQMDTHKDTSQGKVYRPIGSLRLQQAFLRLILDALMTQLYWSQEQASTSTVRRQCATVASLQRWQRHSRQRCVNAVPLWDNEHHAVVWRLTVGDPRSILAAA